MFWTLKAAGVRMMDLAILFYLMFFVKPVPMSFDHFISFETFRFVLTPVCGNKNTEILLDKFLIGLIV